MTSNGQPEAPVMRVDPSFAGNLEQAQFSHFLVKTHTFPIRDKSLQSMKRVRSQAAMLHGNSPQSTFSNRHLV